MKHYTSEAGGKIFPPPAIYYGKLIVYGPPRTLLRPDFRKVGASSDALLYELQGYGGQAAGQVTRRYKYPR